MQYRALKTFRGRYGLIREGMVVTLDDRYARQLISGGKLARVSLPQAPLNMAHDAAPLFKTASEGSPDSLADGQAPPSSALPRVRRSRKRTSNPSGGEPG